jgi:hypothetical protein
VDAAVAAARAAFKGPWRKFTGAQRAACMNKFADLLEAQIDKFAKLETIAMGQPLSVGRVFVGLTPPGWRCMSSPPLVCWNENALNAVQITLGSLIRLAERCFRKMMMVCIRSFATSLSAYARVSLPGMEPWSLCIGRLRQPSLPETQLVHKHARRLCALF